MNLTLNKIYELRKIESIFLNYLLSDLIIDRAEKIIKLQNSIHLNKLHYLKTRLFHKKQKA